MNWKTDVLIVGIQLLGASKIDMEKTNCRIPRHFVMRHLPSVERLRERQTSSLAPNLSILPRKVYLLFCRSSYDIKIPNARTGSLGHLNPNGFSSLSRQGPSHKALVLVVFKRKPEKFPKESNPLIAFSTDWQLLQINDVSSANWLILTSELKIWFLVFLYLDVSCMLKFRLLRWKDRVTEDSPV